MAPPYNMSAFEASNNVYGWFASINTSTGGFLGPLALSVVFLALLVMLYTRNNPGPESWFAASLVTTVAAVVFLWIGLVPVYFVVLFSVICALAAVSAYKSNSV